MLTLLCAVGAWAQLTPKSDVEDGYYLISCPPKNNSFVTSTGVSDSRLGISSTKANDCIFTITQGTGDNAGKYTIKFGDKYVTYSATGNGDKVRLVEEASATDANKWWVFVEDEGNASYVDIFPYAASIARGDGSWNFSVTVNGVANSAIGLWNGDDGNSKWKLTPSTGNADRDILGDAIAVANASVGTTVGCYPQSAIAAAQAVYDGTDDLKTYAEATTALQNALVLPERGKYYTITSAYSGFMNNQGVTKSVYVDGGILKWKTTNLADPTMYWEIYNDGSKYVFKNYSTGTFVSAYASKSSQYSVGETAAANSGFTWFDGGQCNISVAGGNFHTASHSSGGGVNGNVMQYGSGKDNASSWYIIEVDPRYEIDKTALANRLNELKKGQQLGINPGQYTLSGMTSEAYANAITEAEAVLNGGSTTGSDYASALGVLENAVESAVFKKNEMVVGKYYRIQSTTRGTYTGVQRSNEKTGESKMWNYADNANDPGQIWKLEQEGENYYLVNILSGLYPQYVNGGSDKTTYLGAKSESYKFTHDIYSEASSTAYPRHRIYFGGRQVNIETAGCVNWWTEENARHYIWTVEKSDDEILALAREWVKSQSLTANASASKITVTPDVTQVISPSEFAAPEVVNTAIDALTAYTSTDNPTLEQAQAVWNNASIVNTYVNSANTYEGLLSVDYTLQAKYGTIILPINYSRPTNVKLYSCNAAQGSVLTLTEYTGVEPKNTPFIIEYTDEESLPTAEAPKKYQFIGYNKDAGKTNVTAGWLTGVLSDETTTVSAGNYVLSKYKGKLGFYKVGESASVTCPQYKCYLSKQASARAFYFDDEDVETGINAVEIEEATPTNAVIYDLSGRRVQSAKSGLYIVNGKKVIK